MLEKEIQDMLMARHNAIVAINRSAGGPHLSPVWYLWDGEVFYFRVATNTAKYRHIQRDPAISLIVNDQAGFRYLVAYGKAQIIEDKQKQIAAKIVRRYYAPDVAPLKMPPAQESDVVTIKLQPEKIVSVIEEIAKEANSSWSTHSQT